MSFPSREAAPDASVARGRTRRAGRHEALNRRNHGASFEDAATAFAAPTSLTVPDPAHSLDGSGSVGASRPVLPGEAVVHTARADSLRIISARKGNGVAKPKKRSSLSKESDLFYRALPQGRGYALRTSAISTRIASRLVGARSIRCENGPCVRWLEPTAGLENHAFTDAGGNPSSAPPRWTGHRDLPPAEERSPRTPTCRGATARLQPCNGVDGC